ncbi:glycosyltransferase family 4 protein [Lacimicrobium alkaliphilum]|uniref:Glycosyl transferase family 1 n=1 Tax=Lacimicrobium alkaliphilum TaxID=1526571 RepID=A0ABQ1RSJ9_9ALTE|nr:glycosyltransferase family 4 protein [Lacimicrobium alkaliphilum]GGD76687.1 glycosyl transferase family 1 [Lacimicrobium alkaliphilum]
MKVVQAHNFYASPGGEDRVVEREASIIRAMGHELIPWYCHNNASPGMAEKIRAALCCSWNPRAMAHLQELGVGQGDILHVHNFFPWLSPAIFYQARQLGMKTVLTLHNFRLLTPTAVIESQNPSFSVKKNLLQAVSGAYQGSAFAGLAVARMIARHHAMGTWQHQVDTFICPSDFVRRQFLCAGFDPEKLVVKAHFCDDPTSQKESVDLNGQRQYVLFVGRDDKAKGLDLLLRAWWNIDMPLIVAGVSRPRNLSCPPQVVFKGQQQAGALSQLYAGAALVVVPSRVAETFGNVVMEAFAHQTPVLVSGSGALSELVQPGENGHWFDPENVDDLAVQVERMLKETELLRRFGHNARQTYLKHYTPQRNLAMLEAIYQNLTDRDS